MSTLPNARQPRIPDPASEARLAEIRRQAEMHGMVPERGIRPAGAPFPRASSETGYYGMPLLKEPQWTAAKIKNWREVLVGSPLVVPWRPLRC